MRWLVFVFLLLCQGAVAAPTAPVAVETGYLLSLHVQGADIRLDRVTALSGYQPAKPFVGAGAWRVELVGRDGAVAWTSRVPDPAGLALGMPVGQPLLMAIRIPARDDAQQVRLRSAEGEIRFERAIDNAFVQQANTERHAFKQWLSAHPKVLPDRPTQAAASIEANQVRDDAYLTRQMTMAQQRAAEARSRQGVFGPCDGPDQQFIPELAATSQPCVSPTSSPLPPGDAASAVASNPAAMPSPNAKVRLTVKMRGDSGQSIGGGFWVWVEDSAGNQLYYADANGEILADVESGSEISLYPQPPLPWVRDVHKLAPIAVPATREIRFTRGIVLRGQVRATGLTIPVNPNYLWLNARYGSLSTPGMQHSVTLAVAADGTYEMAVPRNASVWINLWGLPVPFMFDELGVGPFSTDQMLNLTPVRGVVVTGRIMGEQQQMPAGAYLHYFPDGLGYGWGAALDADGRFQIVVSGNRGYTFAAGATLYFEQSLHRTLGMTDLTLDFTLERGALLTGKVRERTGGPTLSGAIVMVQSLPQASTRTVMSTAEGYNLLLRRQSQNRIEFGRDYSEVWPTPIKLSVATADITRDLLVPPRHNVRIRLQDANGMPLNRGRVEISSGNTFIAAATANVEGIAELSLVAGTYTARAMPGLYGGNNSDYSSLHLYGHALHPTSLVVAGPTALDIRLAADDVAKMRLQSTTVASADFSWDWYGGYRGYELLSAGKVVAASRNYIQFEYVGSSVRLVGDVYLPAGRTYQLRLHIPGFPSVTSASFVGQTGATIAVTLPALTEARRWRGVLRDRAGKPLPGLPVSVRNPAQDYAGYVDTAANGGFDVPACAGCSYHFHAPADGDTTGHLEVLSSVEQSFTRDVVLKDTLRFPTLPTTDRTLGLLYGDPAGDRHDILFIGDGYTANNESFTDSNHNGVWDGVLYYDLNGNNRYDSGEPYGIYGQAAMPQVGIDPTLQNEPFQDTNGDRALNVAEGQLFFRNARDVMRSLLTFDYWREHRNAFRAWTYLAYSQQAGTNVDVAGRGRVVTRNTLLGAVFEDQRGLLGIDYTRASQLAAEVMPGFDTLVVLINQPVPVGRANSFMLLNGGVLSGTPNSSTVAHEFGHNVGWLADEYNEFGGTYLGPNYSGHMTRTLERALVPWSASLPASIDATRPTPDFVPGVGLFEGGGYQGHGIYRSTADSMMRYAAPLLSQAQKDVLVTVVDPAIFAVETAVDGDIRLHNNVAATAQVGLAGQWTDYVIAVPPGARNLSIRTSGGSGNAHLLVQYEGRPSVGDTVCQRLTNGTAHACEIATPAAGLYQIAIYGASAYSGLNLVAKYTATLTESVAVTGLAAPKDASLSFTIAVPANMRNLRFVLSGGTGNADLYVRRGSAASPTTYGCASTGPANAETCAITNPTAGTWHVQVYGHAAFAGAKLIASYDSNYPLTLRKGGAGNGSVRSANGAVSCGPNNWPCTTSLTSGASIVLTPTPSVGSSFVGWTGCTTVSGTNCTIVANRAYTVTATFSNVPPTATLRFDNATTGSVSKTIVRNSGTSVVFAWKTTGLPAGATCKILLRPNDSYNKSASPAAGGTVTDANIHTWAAGIKKLYLRCSQGATIVTSPDITLTIQAAPATPPTATLRFDNATTGPVGKTIVRNSGMPVMFAWKTTGLPAGSTCKILLRPNDSYNKSASPAAGGTVTDANIHTWAAGIKKLYLRCSNNTTSPDITLTIATP